MLHVQKAFSLLYCVSTTHRHCHMFQTLLKSTRRSSVVLFSGTAIVFLCDGRPVATRAENVSAPPTSSKKADIFHGQCFERHVYKPSLPYPVWDYDWDKCPATNRNTTGALADQDDCPKRTRHIILVRHGQYEQRGKADHQRVLTPLGRRQAEYTGQRLAKMVAANSSTSAAGENNDAFAGPCRIKSIHVSGMARAKETGTIIASYLRDKGTIVTKPDPLLNEALPAPIIPMRPDVGSLEEQASEIDANQDRIEEAFQKYIHRSDDDTGPEHEFEVIVCHANVIRYILLRALQLPPEAWLRFSLFNCSITYLMVQPNGYVTVRLVGDTGHIPYDESTFSGAYGYNWKSPTST